MHLKATFFGLLPLLFESSSQAAWLKPIGVTLAFGVMFATVISLILVPTGYMIMEDVMARVRPRGAPQVAEDPV